MVFGEFNVTLISYQNLLLETKQGQHPTLIGPLLVHEKKTKETYSLFCGALRTLKPDLANLLTYGTDDEEALSSAFGENFERITQLLCSIHLKKNVENRLVEMGITGKIKERLSQIYLADKLAKGKWSKCHANGLKFFQWLVKNKEKKMLNHVIAPVRQRGGLGCPPSKFTTNRSERTNGVIQDFIKRHYGLRRVNVFHFVLLCKISSRCMRKKSSLPW